MKFLRSRAFNGNFLNSNWNVENGDKRKEKERLLKIFSRYFFIFEKKTHLELITILLVSHYINVRFVNATL